QVVLLERADGGDGLRPAQVGQVVAGLAGVERARDVAVGLAVAQEQEPGHALIIPTPPNPARTSDVAAVLASDLEERLADLAEGAAAGGVHQRGEDVAA